LPRHLQPTYCILPLPYTLPAHLPQPAHYRLVSRACAAVLGRQGWDPAPPPLLRPHPTPTHYPSGGPAGAHLPPPATRWRNCTLPHTPHLPHATLPGTLGHGSILGALDKAVGSDACGHLRAIDIGAGFSQNLRWRQIAPHRDHGAVTTIRCPHLLFHFGGHMGGCGRWEFAAGRTTWVPTTGGRTCACLPIKA